MLRFIILLGFALVYGDFQSDKQAACDRDVKIVAASKALNPGEFYIFEEWKAWLYDAKNQKLLEHYDIEDKIRSDSPEEPIIRASAVVNCYPWEGLSLHYVRIVTKQTSFEFRKYDDFKDVSNWTSEDTAKLTKRNEVATESKIKGEVDTIGTACDRDGPRTFQHFHKYKRENIFLYHKQIEEGIQRQTRNIYPPYNIETPIKESTSFPEALAFQFDVEQKNQAALFVYDNTIFYSTSDNGSHWVTTEANIEHVFGCKSSIMTFVVIFLAVFVFVVILGAVFAVLTVFKRHKDFEEDVSTVATVANRKGPPKAVKRIK